tara:strand:- start:43 stop:225 length:183 start_codon:yes stop_codon:yes gene_type:complete
MVMMDLMEIWTLITTIVTVASAVSAATPTKADDNFMQNYVQPVIDTLALNFFNAKCEKKQ